MEMVPGAGRGARRSLALQQTAGEDPARRAAAAALRGSSRNPCASCPHTEVDRKSGRCPYRWGEPNAVNTCTELKIVSGPEKALNKYYLVLVKDVFIQSILLVEQIFYGYEILTQEQANYVFQNNSILLILPSKFLVCQEKSFSLSRWIIISVYFFSVWDQISVSSWRKCRW